MTTMHEEWTEKLSDYLDDELAAGDRRAVDAHLSACAHCAGILDELKRVVTRARSIGSRPPQSDLWAGIAGQIEASLPPGATPLRPPHAPLAVQMASRRVSLSLLQLAAAAVVLMAVSGGLVWSIAGRPEGRTDGGRPGDGSGAALQVRSGSSADLQVRRDDYYDSQVANVTFADQQYDAAVADLEKAVHRGRGRLDASTIAIVEHNLQIIDQAIAQARQALAADPANSYLSSHLVEARRRKLDLLRRAAALTGETD
jgi:Putative zinc-finger